MSTTLDDGDDGLNVENDVGDVANVDVGGGRGRRTRSGDVTRGTGPVEQLHRCHVDDGRPGSTDKSSSSTTCEFFQTSRSLNLVTASMSLSTTNRLIVAGEYPTTCSRRQVRGLGEPTLAGRVQALVGDDGTTVKPLVSVVC